VPEVVKQLRLRFRDSNDAIVSFTVNPPSQPVDMQEVEELMDYIISSNTFYTFTGGSVAEKLDVLLVTTETDTVIEF
jgi:hypothetical protein